MEMLSHIISYCSDILKGKHISCVKHRVLVGSPGVLCMVVLDHVRSLNRRNRLALKEKRTRKVLAVGAGIETSHE